MGKTKTAFVGETTEKPQSRGEKKYREKREKKEVEKQVRVPGLKGGQRIVAISSELPPLEETTTSKTTSQALKTREPKKRSKKYLAATSKIDPTKKYSIPEAVDLAKKTSISHFPGKLELHVNLDKKGLPASRQANFEVTLPYSPGNNKKRIEIANEETIKKLEKGTIDFDVLIATPDFMPRLTTFARLLGPKGLMPNPKNGTIAQNPEKAAEKFSGNTLFLKTEKDAPVVHTVVGSLTDPQDHLVKNTETLLKTLSPSRVKKAILSPTMGPGVRVAVT